MTFKSTKLDTSTKIADKACALTEPRSTILGLSGRHWIHCCVVLWSPCLQWSSLERLSDEKILNSTSCGISLYRVASSAWRISILTFLVQKQQFM